MKILITFISYDMLTDFNLQYLIYVLFIFILIALMLILFYLKRKIRNFSKFYHLNNILFKLLLFKSIFLIIIILYFLGLFSFLIEINSIIDFQSEFLGIIYNYRSFNLVKKFRNHVPDSQKEILDKILIRIKLLTKVNFQFPAIYSIEILRKELKLLKDFKDEKFLKELEELINMIEIAWDKNMNPGDTKEYILKMEKFFRNYGGYHIGGTNAYLISNQELKLIGYPKGVLEKYRNYENKYGFDMKTAKLAISIKISSDLKDYINKYDIIRNDDDVAIGFASKLEIDNRFNPYWQLIEYEKRVKLANITESPCEDIFLMHSKKLVLDYPTKKTKINLTIDLEKTYARLSEDDELLRVFIEEENYEDLNLDMATKYIFAMCRPFLLYLDINCKIENNKVIKINSTGENLSINQNIIY